MSQSQKSMRCPFDPSHVMPYDRFLNHIDKCKYPQKHLYSKCRFNPYHIIHQDLINKHQDNCADRTKYEPIEDDAQDWWGAEEKQKQKSAVSSVSKYQTGKSEDKSLRVKGVQEQKRYQKVQIEDFDSVDFSKRRH